MLDRITGKPVHAYIQFIGCLGIAAGMPWSKVPLSLSFVLLALNFLLRGDFGDVYSNLKRKKAFWFFLGFVAMELLSFLWTENKAQALADLNVRAPFYALPLLIAAKPLSNRKQIHWIGFTFILVCLITSFINIGSYLHWWGNKVYDDFRGLSLFVSHIRYGLIIVLATVFCLAWFIYKLPYRWIAIPLISWFVFYTYFAQIISGYLAFAACVFVIALLYLFSIKKSAVRWAISGTFIAIATIFCVWIYNSVQPEPHKVKIEDLPSHTVNGNLYCETVGDFWENGNPVYGWYCPQELSVAWNKRSMVDYDTGISPNGEHIYNVLIRYMTSRGITKDSLGMTKMTEEDVRNVEKGVNSVRELEGGLKSRLYTISFQLQDRTNPNGHSLLERLEYWRAARAIIKENWLLGVGIGDVQDEFYSFYERDHSALHYENRHRAHQMYFTVIISSGILAFILFMLWWLAQIKVAWRLKSLSWLCFIAIAMTSFLIEDTVETQLGGMFVSFFFGLFIAHPRWFMKNSKSES